MVNVLLATFVVCGIVGRAVVHGATTCGKTSSSSIVSTTTDSKTRYIKATGCPGYDWSSQSTPNTATYQCMSYNIPLNPVINTNKLYVGAYYDTAKTKPVPTSSIVMGPIGIASNGVMLFGNSDNQGRDAYVYEGSTFDTCRGHPSPFGAYHYHAVPASGCVFSDAAGKHSPLWGFMADGIPIYGIYGDNGVQPLDLDECGGHTDNTYSFYHYHATNLVYPYLTNCLVGCFNGSNIIPAKNVPACSPSSIQYDYSSLRSAWTSVTGYSCSTGQ